MIDGLERDALRAWVGDLAATPRLWAPHVRHRPDERIFVELETPPGAEAWLICWMPGHDTGFHDHDLSNGAVAIVEGELVEERLAIGGPPRRQRYGAGTSFHFDASHVHRMHQADSGPTISIHAYSPPLWRMGAYTIEPDGALRRSSISYAEELRPADTEAA